MQHLAFDRVAVAHGAGEQAARDPGIGKVAALAQRRRELGILAIQLLIVPRLTSKRPASSSSVAPSRQYLWAIWQYSGL